MKMFTYRGLCIVLASLIVCLPVISVASEKVPEFHLTHFSNGHSVSSEQLKGKVLYIDFWASWCKPCRKTFPFMNDLTTDYKDKDFKVIAINMDENKSEAEDFLQKYPADFAVFINEGNRLAEALNLPGLPTAYIVDKKGIIRATHTGFRKNNKQKALAQIRYLVEQE